MSLLAQSLDFNKLFGIYFLINEINSCKTNDLSLIFKIKIYNLYVFNISFKVPLVQWDQLVLWVQLVHLDHRVHVVNLDLEENVENPAFLLVVENGVSLVYLGHVETKVLVDYQGFQVRKVKEVYQVKRVHLAMLAQQVKWDLRVLPDLPAFLDQVVHQVTEENQDFQDQVVQEERRVLMGHPVRRYINLEYKSLLCFFI